ncbi:MAG: hypothetical protein PSU93_11960 [Methylobacter sp.]|uniref:Uncharacterized protein n=1 Tax=Candidatus Methylobacter titanis TaxID=3053457 RepID=A0AA43Q6X0_9GAMM|nr:hypothetical protein [Candidatus Methylobacter titanis]
MISSADSVVENRVKQQTTGIEDARCGSHRDITEYIGFLNIEKKQVPQDAETP